MYDSVVSYKNPNFASKFWKRLMELCGVKLKTSSTRNSQTDDGLSKVLDLFLNWLRLKRVQALDLAKRFIYLNDTVLEFEDGIK